jgi:hypothetical protein
MSRARILELMAMKETIQLQAYRKEATRLFEEIDRLVKRRAQIDDLEQGYREHLATPQLRAQEYRDVLQLIALLRERREVDAARREILDAERERLTKILSEKKRQIERLQEEAKRIKILLRQELEDRQATLLPARRK